jgi:hypothetical protein
MKRTDTKSEFLPLPSTAEMEQFASTGIGGPTAVDFRVDVRGSNQRSPWNKRCADIFAALYISRPDALDRDPKRVTKGFLSHIKQLCNQYAVLNSTSPTDMDRVKSVMRKEKKRRDNRRANVGPFSDTVARVAHFSTVS